MESQATLIRTQSRVELDSEATVHLQLAIVVFPHNAKLNDALWDGRDGQSGTVFGVVAEKCAVFEGASEFY